MFAYPRPMGAVEALRVGGGATPIPPGALESGSEATRLRELARQVAPVALAGARTLPVRWDLADLVVGGLRRGTVIELDGRGATSLALGLAAAPSVAGSWVAVVGLPALGLLAAADAGIHPARTAVVRDPGERWATAVAALVDAVDVVLTGRPPRVRAADARRLTARVRERGSVLLVVGGGWPDRTDLHLSVSLSRWSGLGDGHGHLRERCLEVVIDGRGGAGRRRRHTIDLTGPWPDDGERVR